RRKPPKYSHFFAGPVDDVAIQSKPQRRRMITLEVTSGEASGLVQSFDSDAQLISIGRAPGNRIVLPDFHLSGEHGQIFREDDRYIYRDLKSTNGSRVQRGVNGEVTEVSLDGSDDAWELALEDGDRLLLGS